MLKSYVCPCNMLHLLLRLQVVQDTYLHVYTSGVESCTTGAYTVQVSTEDTFSDNWRAGASQPSRIYVRAEFYRPTVVRRVSVHARLCTRFFLSETISKFVHIFTHAI